MLLQIAPDRKARTTSCVKRESSCTAPSSSPAAHIQLFTNGSQVVAHSADQRKPPPRPQCRDHRICLGLPHRLVYDWLVSHRPWCSCVGCCASRTAAHLPTAVAAPSRRDPNRRLHCSAALYAGNCNPNVSTYKSCACPKQSTAPVVMSISSSCSRVDFGFQLCGRDTTHADVGRPCASTLLPGKTP